MFLNSNTKEIALSIDNVCITGKDVSITEMSIRREPYEVDNCFFDGKLILKRPQYVTIDLKLVCMNYNLIQEIFDDTIVNKKIRYKKVEDCTINELLFSIQQKLKNDSLKV